MNSEFKKHLINENLSENTIISYLTTVTHYFTIFNDIDRNSLVAYKGFLVENYKPKSVNLKIQAINKYLSHIHKDNLRLKFIKIQRKNYLENVISYPVYVFLLNKLKIDRNYKWYFIVRYLGATGSRVSELIQIKVEHINVGYIDLYTKGGKVRRIYIPKSLCEETKEWLIIDNIKSGYLFTNKYNQKITTRGLAHQLKKYGADYNLDTKFIYPHSFRHMFAKYFLEKNQDIALLADLMGHESIETTRIYLRRTSEEQKEIVDNIITW